MLKFINFKQLKRMRTWEVYDVVSDKDKKLTVYFFIPMMHFMKALLIFNMSKKLEGCILRYFFVIYGTLWCRFWDAHARNIARNAQNKTKKKQWRTFQNEYKPCLDWETIWLWNITNKNRIIVTFIKF